MHLTKRVTLLLHLFLICLYTIILPTNGNARRCQELGRSDFDSGGVTTELTWMMKHDDVDDDDHDDDGTISRNKHG